MDKALVGRLGQLGTISAGGWRPSGAAEVVIIVASAIFCVAVIVFLVRSFTRNRRQ
jgi:hypothetical protein